MDACASSAIGGGLLEMRRPRGRRRSRPVMAAAATMTGRHQDGAAGGRALAALEVAVGGRGAELVADELVGVHGEAHRAAGAAPLEAGVAEDLRRGLPARTGLATICEPGTTMAFTPGATLWPRMYFATSRKSESRPLVQEPMKATSIFMPLIGVPAVELHVGERFLDGGLVPAGWRPWRGPGCSRRWRCRGPGMMPQVTVGAMSAASMSTMSS